jgi:peptide/nickel transport system substrate-binding protein
MGIDRETIGKTLVSGGAAEPVMNAICFPTTAACSWSIKPPGYDPEGAKKLFAEAGYPGGFAAPFYVHSPIKQVGEAIALQLQKIGIRSSIESLPITVYTQKRGEGQLTMFVGSRPTATYPETTQVFTALFGGQRDYAHDPLIDQAVAAAEKTFDVKERAKILQPAIDRNNEMVYVLPIAVLPTVIAHGKNVRLEPNQLATNDLEIGDYFWK